MHLRNRVTHALRIPKALGKAHGELAHHGTPRYKREIGQSATTSVYNVADAAHGSVLFQKANKSN